MHKVQRLPLTQGVIKYLGKKQAAVNQGEDVDKLWTRARQTKTIGTQLFGVLEKMAGIRCLRTIRRRSAKRHWTRRRFRRLASDYYR